MGVTRGYSFFLSPCSFAHAKIRKRRVDEVNEEGAHVAGNDYAEWQKTSFSRPAPGSPQVHPISNSCFFSPSSFSYLILSGGYFWGVSSMCTIALFLVACSSPPVRWASVVSFFLFCSRSRGRVGEVTRREAGRERNGERKGNKKKPEEEREPILFFFLHRF